VLLRVDLAFVPLLVGLFIAIIIMLLSLININNSGEYEQQQEACHHAAEKN
jgi:hypothetical protein